jgi:hypothetical protein
MTYDSLGCMEGTLWESSWAGSTVDSGVAGAGALNASIEIVLQCNTSTWTEIRIDCDGNGVVGRGEVYSECKHTCEPCPPADPPEEEH